jgi:hypothetical protein
MSTDPTKTVKKEEQTKDDQGGAARSLFDEIGFEAFAIHLLLTSPTDLTKAWARTDTKPEGDNAIEAHLPSLTALSDDGKRALRDVAAQLWSARAAFHGVGQHAGTSIYGGSEPHPDGPQANEIIRRIKRA